MTGDWVRLALNNAQCLDALFLNASRHLSVMHQYQPDQGQQQKKEDKFTNLAVRYKLLCIKTVSETIAKSSTLTSSSASQSFEDTTFLEILSLAFDELLLNDPAMTRSHIQGAIKMVELNGGWNTLGLDGFMEIILLRYAERVGLLLHAAALPCVE